MSSELHIPAQVIRKDGRSRVSERIFYALENIFSDPQTKVLFEYTQVTYRVLLFIDTHEPCHPSDIAEELSTPRPNIAQTLAALESKKYIRRKRDRRDRRRVFILLTEEGRAALDRRAEQFAALADRWESYLENSAPDFADQLETIAEKTLESAEASGR